MDLADLTRLIIAIIASVGGLAAFAAWREARTTQTMLRQLAAHQLRTPLSVIVAALHTLHKHKDRLSEEKVCELLDVALMETSELERLIAAFMSLESGKRRDHAREAPAGHPRSRRSAREIVLDEQAKKRRVAR